MEMNHEDSYCCRGSGQLVASPTFANQDPDVGSGNIVAAPYDQTPDGGNVFQHDGTYNHKAMSRSR